jgi:pimeloyl-ACP methyl ester carboxylesterase
VRLFRWLILIPLVFLPACSSPTALKTAGGDLSQAQISSKELSSGVANGTYVKKRMQISLEGKRDAYVLLFLHGDSGSTVTARPTVLMTLPYEGFDWSEDAVDRRWSTAVGATSGYAGLDSDSTGFTGVGSVGYKLKSETDLFGEAYFYLLHGMNVAFVFNRFYAGQSYAEHALDTALALRYLAKQTAVDADRIGVYGLSWGGMTAAYGAILSGVPVRQMTLLSPALDLQGLSDYFTSWIPANVTSTSQKTAFADFFSPYGRRIAAASLSTPSQIATQLSAAAAHTTIMADDSDTLVPASQTRAIAAAMPAAKVSGLWWTHADAINFETASLSHESHATSPLVFSDVMTIMQMEMAYALLPSSTNMTILIYDMDQWNTYLLYMRGEQLRGQDMTAFTRMLMQVAGPRVTILNQQDNTQTGSGSAFVSIWLQVHWGVTIAPADVLTTLQTTGLPN